ncbi:protein Iojap, chloroplastic [Vicia villosa]|uniref:protein Iojap, chloroplastic n=1 Tax=Vicia villosa TaxID=3911 RepID=UPI00273B60F2|nr:protein Iojap, chloroplastic [Vicia villosa]
MLPSSTLLSLAGPAVSASFSGDMGHPQTNSSPKPTKVFTTFRKKVLPLQSINGLNLKRRNSILTFAFGKEAKDNAFSDVGEDTDDMYDELLNKYGKVVYKKKDQKPANEEIDDDSESLSFAVEMATVASEVKAGDIKVLFVKPIVYWTRFFIIATAFSRPQIDAIGSRIRDRAEKKYGKIPSGDSKPNSWTLLDFGDVVVHLFLPPQRAFYNLEEFYGNATLVELPFENESPFHSERGAFDLLDDDDVES